MKSLTQQRFLGMLLLSILFASVVHGDEVIRWKVKKGQKFDVQMIQKMKQEMSVGGRDVNVNNDTVIYMSWDVDNVDEEGLIYMTQTIDRMTMKVSGTQDIQFDSADEKEPTGVAATVYNSVKPLIGVKFTQVMTDQGEVKDVTLPEDAIKATKNNPMLAQIFSEDALKEMVTKAAPVMPTEAIKKGHSWTKDADVKSPAGQMGISNTYTYLGPTEVDGQPLEKIGVDLKLEFKGGNPFGAKISVKDQNNKGSILFDNVNGHFSSSEIKQKMTLEITVGPQTINQKLETDIQLKLTKAK
jgi:hypothetical protein